MDQITFSSQLLQYAITGMTIGSVYAMVAIGFNIIYNVTEIINLAQRLSSLKTLANASRV